MHDNRYKSTKNFPAQSLLHPIAFSLSFIGADTLWKKNVAYTQGAGSAAGK